MRKRRRLANKMIIMVCAVLLAVSAFFYAPMYVEAEDLDYQYSGSSTANSIYGTGGSFCGFDIYVSFNSDLFSNVFENIDSDSYYLVDMDWLLTFSPVYSGYVETFPWYFCPYDSDVSFFSVDSNGGYGNKTWSNNSSFVIKGSSLLDNDYRFRCRIKTNEKISFDYNYMFDYTINSVTALTGEESASYQQGYNAGYSAGETAGESNGYSNGYSDGYDNGYGAGETNGYESGYEQGSYDGYNSGFQAGADSVDTQSYYDAGYQAGYQVAYSEGYESGYDVGYQNVMDRIANWGADTSDYPILVYNKNLSDVSCEMEVVTNMPSVGHGLVNLCNLDIDINPSHTYKIVFDSVYPTTTVVDFSGSQDEQFNYNIGLFSIPWSSGESFGFVQGSSLSSVFRLEVYDYSAHYYEIGGENDVFEPWRAAEIYNFESIDVFVYDMGPSGDTQNHIANQTDQLTHGYDSSNGDSANSSLSTGLNEFETAENSLFATATTGMKDFTFFDFESVPAMLTAVTFITSIMGSWFEQAGGASGVGIVLSILFSVMLVSMVLGLYRLYQSAGHRAEARERHRERMEQWKRGK